MSSTERGSSPSSVPAIASRMPNFQSSLSPTFSSLNNPVSYTNHLPSHSSFANQQSSQHPYNMSNLTSPARIATPFESNNRYHDFRISASNTPSTSSTLLSPIIDTNSNALLQDFDASSQNYGPQLREMQQARFIPSNTNLPAFQLQIIANASHEQLSRSGNEAYNSMNRALSKTETAYQTLENAYQKLVNAVPQLLGLVHDHGDGALNGLSTTSSRPELSIFASSTRPASKVDYPKVQFWDRRAWDTYMKNKKDTTSINQSAPQRGGARKSQNINVTMQFVEDADGVPVDGDRAGAMRRHARAIWDHFATKGIPVKTWTKTDSLNQQYYYSDMCRQFPELRLCDLNWKADKIAVDGYSSWYSNRHPATSVTIKNEADSTDKRSLVKRAGTPSLIASQSKKLKKADPSTTAITQLSISPTRPQSPPRPVSPPLHGHQTNDNESEQALQDVEPVISVNKDYSGRVEGVETTTEQQEVGRGGIADTAGPPKPIALINPLLDVSGSLPLIESSRSADIQKQAATAATLKSQGPSTTSNASFAEDKAAGQSKPGVKMRPGKTATARNLYAIDYLASHPNTTPADFKKVWDSLESTTREKYTKASREKKEAGNG